MALDPRSFTKGVIEQSIGFATGELIATALEPIAQAERNKVWQRLQSARLDPTMAAQAELEGVWNRSRALEEAAQSGIDAERYDAIFQVLDTSPSLGDTIDLWRRGVIGDNEVEQSLADDHLARKWFDSIKALKRALLSAPDLALARQQGFISETEQKNRSQSVGVVPDDADLLYEMAGLPPGIETAIEMLRRGIIDQSGFAQIVREGHTKTKYTDELLRLVNQVPSVAAAVEGVLRERIPREEGYRIAEENGYNRESFDLLYEIAGRPIGIMQALTLYNRGVYSPKDVENVVARSNVRPEFTEAILHLAVRYPPLFQVSRLVQSGAVDDAYAIDLITKQGYEHKLAEGIVKSAHNTKTTHQKDLSISVIETLYDAGLETSEQARKLLSTLGYDDTEARELLNVHDARRYASEMARAATIIRNKYVQHIIDRGTALAQIGELAGSPDARDRILKLWDLEREANVRGLTPAEIGQALKYQIITDEQAIERWMNLGYSREDAEIKGEIVHKGPTHPAVGTTP